jgi:hypothetical protein
MTESILFALLLKSLVVVAVAGGAVLALRRSSAAVRCLAARLGLGLLLALPLLAALVPTWSLELLPADPISVMATPDAALPPQPETPPPAFSWFLTNYGIGVAVALFRTGAALTAAAVLARRAVPLERRDGYAVVLAPDAPTPFAFGHWNPRVVLPTAALDWDPALREDVIAHEAAHVARRDWTWLVLGRIASALYWPNPGVQWLLHRSRMDAEIAADDRVLQAGQDHVRYAEHLVRVARACRSTTLLAPLAAEPPLTTRLRALLHEGTRREAPRRGVAPLAFAVALLALTPLAALAVGPRQTTVKATSARPAPRQRIVVTTAKAQSQSEGRTIRRRIVPVRSVVGSRRPGASTLRRRPTSRASSTIAVSAPRPRPASRPPVAAPAPAPVPPRSGPRMVAPAVAASPAPPSAPAVSISAPSPLPAAAPRGHAAPAQTVSPARPRPGRGNRPRGSGRRS